ncbi:MAG: hypothetical protein LBC80_04290 [Treponema sp.]|jgi:hypothetical protein|nr:hypothetical protein [Treponema sp.]
MSFKNRFFIIIFVVLIAVFFFGCSTLAANLGSNPGSPVGLGQANSDGIRMSFSFGRTISDSVSQYYFEVQTYAEQYFDINTLMVGIDNNDAIILRGNTPSRMRMPSVGGLQGSLQETVRFVITYELSDQLLYCNNLTLHVTNQQRNIPDLFQRPINISFSGISAIKANINYWNNPDEDISYSPIITPDDANPIDERSQTSLFPVGLYLEATIPPFIKQINNNTPNIFSGATYMDFGLGMTFLNEHLKLQANYGFMTQRIYESMGGTGRVRYGGHVLGFKMLGGYNFSLNSWLDASISLGANFSLFDIAKQGYTQSGKPAWLNAVVMQIEFPKITIPEQKIFKKFSLFTEGQLWFVPTDVDIVRQTLTKCVMGLRTYIF